jgi:hypothetical protein
MQWAYFRPFLYSAASLEPVAGIDAVVDELVEPSLATPVEPGLPPHPPARAATKSREMALAARRLAKLRHADVAVEPITNVEVPRRRTTRENLTLAVSQRGSKQQPPRHAASSEASRRQRAARPRRGANLREHLGFVESRLAISGEVDPPPQANALSAKTGGALEPPPRPAASNGTATAAGNRVARRSDRRRVGP